MTQPTGPGEREPIDVRRARSIMFTLLEARLEAATVEDLRLLREHLATSLDALGAEHPAARHVLEALTEVLFVEAQLRSDHVDTAIRRLLSDPC